MAAEARVGDAVLAVVGEAVQADVPDAEELHLLSIPVAGLVVVVRGELCEGVLHLHDLGGAIRGRVREETCRVRDALTVEALGALVGRDDHLLRDVEVRGLADVAGPLLVLVVGALHVKRVRARRVALPVGDRLHRDTVEEEVQADADVVGCLVLRPVDADELAVVPRTLRGLDDAVRLLTRRCVVVADDVELAGDVPSGERHAGVLLRALLIDVFRALDLLVGATGVDRVFLDVEADLHQLRRHADERGRRGRRCIGDRLQVVPGAGQVRLLDDVGLHERAGGALRAARREQRQCERGQCVLHQPHVCSRLQMMNRASKFSVPGT